MTQEIEIRRFKHRLKWMEPPKGKCKSKAKRKHHKSKEVTLPLASAIDLVHNQVPPPERDAEGFYILKRRTDVQ